MQQGLRLHGVLRCHATIGVMAYDGVVFGCNMFEELQCFLTVSFVFMELAVAEQEGDDGVYDQDIGGALA